MREIFTELGFRRMTRNLIHKGSREGMQTKNGNEECRLFRARNSLVTAGHGHGGGRRGQEMSRERLGNKVGKISQGRL